MTDAWSPMTNYDTRSYWEGCREKKLIIARCGDCRYWIHPPRGVCPKCWSDNIGYEECDGVAKVYSYVVLPAARQDNSGSDRITVWAELNDQERLIVVADMVGSAPNEVAMEAPLELAWSEYRGHPVPVFKLRAAG
ncbi:Zn-ribbon domain-containing OB-fold protein [Phenylobacterium sp. VNQ135]|uniref:Zn-ribbon domain-containing OB-fold protein n=1 Tax=Phenylobacterium sp. VNQ135 TaxID=3400922 RepID=UPI003BFD27EC